MRISALVAGATLAFGLAACSDSSPDATTSPDTTVAVATYTAKTIDGAPLPWTDTVHNMTLISWAVSLSPDGTWVDALAYLDGTTTSQSGTYTTSGGTTTFISQGNPYQATLVSGGLSSLTFAGHVAQFQQF